MAVDSPSTSPTGPEKTLEQQKEEVVQQTKVKLENLMNDIGIDDAEGLAQSVSESVGGLFSAMMPLFEAMDVSFDFIHELEDANGESSPSVDTERSYEYPKISGNAIQRFKAIQGTEIMTAIREGAAAHGLSSAVHVLAAVADVESRFNPNAANAHNCVGMFQFWGPTWNGSPYAKENRKDVYANSKAGAWYMRSNLDYMGVDVNSPRVAYEAYGCHHCGKRGWQKVKVALTAIRRGTYNPDHYSQKDIPKAYRGEYFKGFGRRVESFKDYAELVDWLSMGVQKKADAYKKVLDAEPSNNGMV